MSHAKDDSVSELHAINKKEKRFSERGSEKTPFVFACKNTITLI